MLEPSLLKWLISHEFVVVVLGREGQRGRRGTPLVAAGSVTLKMTGRTTRVEKASARVMGEFVYPGWDECKNAKDILDDGVGGRAVEDGRGMDCSSL